MTDQTSTPSLPPADVQPAAPALLAPTEPPPPRRVERLYFELTPELLATAGGEPLGTKIAEVLSRAIDPDDVDIKPDRFGSVYLGHHAYRRRLNEAFGVGGWFLHPLGPVAFDDAQHMAYQDFALVAGALGGNGARTTRLLGRARGEQAFRDDEEDRMTKGDVLEGLASNGLMRCCKQVGIGLELWSRKWVAEFRAQHCARVLVSRRSGGEVVAWRRKDADPLPFEVRELPRENGQKAPPPAQARPQGATPPPAQGKVQGKGKAPATPPRAAPAPPPAREPGEEPDEPAPLDRVRAFWDAVGQAGVDSDDVAEWFRAHGIMENTQVPTLGLLRQAWAFVESQRRSRPSGGARGARG